MNSGEQSRSATLLEDISSAYPWKFESISPWYVYPKVGSKGITAFAERREVNKIKIVTFLNFYRWVISEVLVKRE